MGKSKSSNKHLEGQNGSGHVNVSKQSLKKKAPKRQTQDWAVNGRPSKHGQRHPAGQYSNNRKTVVSATKDYKSGKQKFVDQKGQSRKQKRKKQHGDEQLQPQQKTAQGPPKAGQGQFSQNWEQVKSKLNLQKPPEKSYQQKFHKRESKKLNENQSSHHRLVISQQNNLGDQNGQQDLLKLYSGIDSEKYVGLDCEMVGVGPNGNRSVLARACVVDGAGKIVLDVYAKSKERVTQFRTWISGIKWRDIKHAEPIEAVQLQVAEALRGKIVIGHSLKHDFAVLNISHPSDMIRDIAHYPPLMRPTVQGKMPQPRSLKKLAQIELGLNIQHGSHTPVDDARAALYLYAKYRPKWEHYLKLTQHMRGHELQLFLETHPKWMPKQLIILDQDAVNSVSKWSKKQHRRKVTVKELREDHMADL